MQHEKQWRVVASPQGKELLPYELVGEAGRVNSPVVGAHPSQNLSTSPRLHFVMLAVCYGSPSDSSIEAGIGHLQTSLSPLKGADATKALGQHVDGKVQKLALTGDAQVKLISDTMEQAMDKKRFREFRVNLHGLS